MSAANDMISLLDLTLLDETASDGNIVELCQDAQTAHGNVAAVCIYMDKLPVAKTALAGADIKLATVANFPSGDANLNSVLAEIAQCHDLGADEIDVVLPYKTFLSDKTRPVLDFMHEVKHACEAKTLKVILETGAYPDAESIYAASMLALEIGADFIKTSTGKIATGATIEAAQAMLRALEQHRDAGLKISGGVRTQQEAQRYLDLAVARMGADWLTPNHFRFGASSLLSDILSH